MASANHGFHNLKQQILNATDLELHFAALIVFNELSTRRLGADSLELLGNMSAVAVAKKAPRTKTPKKKQDAINVMFHPDAATTVIVGEEIELEAHEIEDLEAGAASISPDPPSEPRPVPKPKAKKN